MTQSICAETLMMQDTQRQPNQPTLSESVVGEDKPTILQEQISLLEEEILSVLLGRELYGLQICQAFEDASGGKRKMSAGTLYPTLARLEKKGLVTSRMADRPTDSKGGAKRKYFQITRRGSVSLADVDRFRSQLAIWQPASA